MSRLQLPRVFGHVIVCSLAFLQGCATDGTANFTPASKGMPGTRAARGTIALAPAVTTVAPDQSASSQLIARQLPVLGTAAKPGGMVVTAGSKFIGQSLEGFKRNLPSLFDIADERIGLVLAKTGDNNYAGGLGWSRADSDDNFFKLSLLRQQSIVAEINGQWLASAQGSISSLPFNPDLSLQGELALAVDDNTSLGLNEMRGASLKLLGPEFSGMRYSLGFRQFGEGFRPQGSLVEADTEEVFADVLIELPADLALAANASYWTGGSDCGYKTSLVFTGLTFAGLDTTLESSLRRALNCHVGHNRYLDTWKLTFAEDSWRGWNLQVALSDLAVISPQTGHTMAENHSLRLASYQKIRLGSHIASFGPSLSIETYNEDISLRQVNSGFVLDIDKHRQDIRLDVSYSSFSGDSVSQEDAFNIKMTYRFDLDV